MSRSLKKGPYVDQRLLAKVERQQRTGAREPLKTWARDCTVVPEFIGQTFLVHNGRQFVHEPLRLNVLIAAPLDAINGVMAKHEGVRELVDNGWLHLFALSDAGPMSHRYRGQLTWEALP